MRLSGTLALAVITLVARAGDPPATPAADSIATAKKDIAEIKSPLNPQDQAGSLPSLEFKDLGPVPGAAAEALSVPTPERETEIDPSGRKSGTGNWLVDAMDKKSDKSKKASERDGGERLRGETDLLRGDERLNLPGEKETQGLDEAGGSAAEGKEVTGPVYNPLDRFMSGWISAKDRDLLLSGARGEGAAAGDSGRVRADFLPGLDAGPSVDALVGPAEAPSLDELRTGPNPYLSVLDITPSPATRGFMGADLSGLTAPLLQDFARAPGSAGVDPRPVDSLRRFIPDFAQPPDDDKYFKQMKRF